MSFLLWEPLIYTIHHMAHWISKWRCGRRIAGHHLRHHAKHTERHAYTDTKVCRQAAEIAGLGVLSWVLDNQDTCLELIRTALVYKIAHTLSTCFLLRRPYGSTTSSTTSRRRKTSVYPPRC